MAHNFYFIIRPFFVESYEQFSRAKTPCSLNRQVEAATYKLWAMGLALAQKHRHSAAGAVVHCDEAAFVPDVAAVHAAAAAANGTAVFAGDAAAGTPVD